jgi:hypothetical protein
MKKLFIVLAAALFVNACTIKEKLGCLAQEKAVELASSVIVDNLQCKNVAQVKISMNNIIAPLNLCPEQTGAIGNLVCPSIANAVVNYLVSNSIPSQWQCSAEMAKDKVRDVLENACKSAVPVAK